MNKIVKNTLILTLITVIAGVLLGAVYEVTKTPIAQSQETAKKEAWQAVFSDVKLDDFKAEDVDQKAADKAVKDMGVNATIDEVCTAGDAGYVITTTDKDGFGGNIQITVGIKKDGTINGVSILSISETAGLGMKATEPSFYNQYVNKQADKIRGFQRRWRRRTDRCLKWCNHYFKSSNRSCQCSTRILSECI